MPPLGPVKRKDLIRYLHRLGFEGPYSGGNHQFMLKENTTVSIPNPHRGDIGRDLLVRIMKQARINNKDWEKL